MNIPVIISKSKRPALYEKGDAFMWTDEHGFVHIKHHLDILPEGDIWNGDNVMFTTASK